uniref:CARD domain-containing protein n=1 Tax=Salmo trutta TaxID=8032 RepID=A0A674BI05_SALTR
MATPVPQRLLATLEKLDKATFETFQWNLMQETLKGFTPMSIANLEDASWHKTVSKMVQAYKKISNWLPLSVGLLLLSLLPDQAATPQSSQDQSAVMETKQYGNVPNLWMKTWRKKNQRFTMVIPIADGLYQKKMIHDEDYSEITAAKTSMSKMRKLYVALKPGGAEAKSAFYKILLDQHPLLVKELVNQI